MKADQFRNFKATIVNFIRGQHLFLIFIKSFSSFNHQLRLFLFKNEVWKCFRKNVRYSFSGHNPCYFHFPMFFLSFGIANASTKIINKPLDYSGISVANCDSGGKINSSSIYLRGVSNSFRFSFHYSFITNRNGALTIYDSSQIRKLSDGKFHKPEAYHSHDINVYRDRLNPETSKEDVIVRTVNINEITEGDSKKFPRQSYENIVQLVTKVTESTAATVPLTDGQTPMGDQLSVTDFQAQIQWLTQPAIVKSALIDLDLPLAA